MARSHDCVVTSIIGCCTLRCAPCVLCRSKGESKRIIDHIWFTKGRRLVPTSRWRMLTEDEIGPAALPSPAYASDHQALCCEFEWRD